MMERLNILLINDSPDDADRALLQLARGGWEVAARRVDSANTLSAALKERSWDVILSDFSTPALSGEEALRLVRGTGLDVPFIILSGVNGEDTAVSMMRAGAQDYVMKDQLGRLLPAVERELHEAAMRHEKRQQERDLQKSEERLRKAQRIANFGSWEWSILTNELIWSEEVYRLYGMDPARDKPSYDVVVSTVAPEYRERFVGAVEDAVRLGRHFECEYRMIGLDGVERFAHTIGEVIRDTEGRPVSMFGVVQDVTQRRAVEKALRKAEELYQELVETAQDLIWQCDGEGRFTYLNPAWETVLRYPVKEMLGRKFTGFQTPECAKRDMETFSGLLRGGMVKGYETVFRSRDGCDVHLVFNAKFIRDEQGSIRGTRGTAYDITERKRAETVLIARERQLAESQRIAHIGSWEHNLKTGEVFWSDELFRLLGLDPAKDPADFHMFFSMVHPGDQPSLRKAIDETLRNKTPFNIDYRFVYKDGRQRTIHAQAELIPDEAGDVVVLSGTGQDITERKHREDALRESEQRLAESQRVAKIGSWSWDIKTGKLYWSDETFRRFDKEPDTFMPTVDYYVGLIHADDRDSVRNAIKDSLENDAPYHIQPRIRNESGREWVLEGFGFVERDTDGKPIRFAGTAQDITERKEAEVRLRESQRSLQAIMDGVADPIMVVGTDYRVTMMNRAAREQSGMTDNVFCHEISHHRETPCGEKGEPCPLEAVKASGTQMSVIHEHFDGAGKVHYIEILASPYRGPDGTLLGIIESSRDITERKRAEDEKLRLERQVLHAQKLESLGVLAGGIAHDFNNILMGILGNASLAVMRLPDDSSARERLREIEKAAQRAADLSSQMLAYSGKGKFLIGPIELNKLVGEMARLLEVSISKKALLRYQFRENIPPFEGDATQVRQVVMNLITNASEALGDSGGIITLSTGSAVCDRAFLDATDEVLLAGYDSPLPEGTYVFIEVSDTGCGMDEATRRKIFDPFFTTKFTGRGLGMAAVLGILRGHRGSIRISSEVGKGTTIRVLFPASGRPAPPLQEKNGAAGTAWRGEGAVLLVDDDKTVRAVGTEMLKHLGFTVLNASNGREAIEVFRFHAREIAAVILDLSMPEMNGEEVFNVMRRERPDLKVVLCSGYTEQDATDALLGKGLAGFLQKPYNINQLSDALRNALQ